MECSGRNADVEQYECLSNQGLRESGTEPFRREVEDQHSPGHSCEAQGHPIFREIQVSYSYGIGHFARLALLVRACCGRVRIGLRPATTAAPVVSNGQHISSLLRKRVTHLVTIQNRVGNAGSLLARSLNHPCAALSHELHFGSLPPPAVDLARKRHP